MADSSILAEDAGLVLEFTLLEPQRRCLSLLGVSEFVACRMTACARQGWRDRAKEKKASHLKKEPALSLSHANTFLQFSSTPYSVW